MNLRFMIRVLRKEARSQKHQSVFNEAKAAHAALAPYENVASLLAVLARRDETQQATRGLVTRALVDAHQRAPRSVWGPILFVAFTPMLLRLKRRLKATELSGADLDQLILISFSEVISTLRDHPRPERTPLYLKQQVSDKVFAFVRKEAKSKAALDMLKRLAVLIRPSSFVLTIREEHKLEYFIEERRWLVRLLRRSSSYVRGSFSIFRLRECVEHHMHDLPPAERYRIYEILKCRRYGARIRRSAASLKRREGGLSNKWSESNLHER